jgi:agmatinase
MTRSGTPTLLGVPYDLASSYLPGAALAPPAIRAALANPSSNSWTEDRLDVSARGVLADDGDLAFSEPADGPAVRAAIEAAVGAILDRGDRPLVLGGDHSISYPAIRAVARRHPGLTILHFDAHSDLYPEFDGDRYSHACPFARIMEDGLAHRLIQVGIRTISGPQRIQIERFGVEVHEMRDWTGPFAVAVDGPLYLSLDLDVLDPAFITGISHPEPGGLSVREVITMIQRLSARVVAADLVELNPTEDRSPRSGLVAAKLVKELVAAFHRR